MEKYAAFISYCHRELDSAVAARLHTLLERFRIPRELAKARGSKTVGRVFRDREELPISGDLAGSIREALDAADFLIVVCTPDTPKSFWVQKEIEYFLSIKPRDRC